MHTTIQNRRSDEIFAKMRSTIMQSSETIALREPCRCENRLLRRIFKTQRFMEENGIIRSSKIDIFCQILISSKQM
jgi:hypothetical protein